MRTLALPLVAVLLVVVLGLLGVLCVFVAPNAHWNRSNPDAEDADRRMDAVREASAIGLPGAVNVTRATPRGIVSATLPREVFGERGQAGPLVSNVSIWRRAFDWTGVDLQGFAGGPAGALLA